MSMINISGKITTKIEYSHEVLGEKFYKFNIASHRLSGNMDIIPCIASEVLVANLNTGDEITLIGDIRTRNVDVEGQTRKRLDVFVFVTETGDYVPNKNYVEMTGYICKEPVYRETPLNRQICDIFVAVNRAYGKSDYIPCITWGRNAIKASYLEIGEKVTLLGRLQSREYVKGDVTKVTYEVSANCLTLDDEEIGEDVE